MRIFSVSSEPVRHVSRKLHAGILVALRELHFSFFRQQIMHVMLFVVNSCQINSTIFIQIWIAYQTLPAKLLSQQRYIDFPNDALPLAENHNAYCQVRFLLKSEVRLISVNRILSLAKDFHNLNFKEFVFRFTLIGISI